MSTAQQNPDRQKAARPGRRRVRRPDRGDVALSRDDRLIWLGIAVVAGIDGGILAGLLTAVAGGTRPAAIGAGGVAALGTFGAVLTVVRFLHGPSEK
jgi:hypothetical protein